MSRPAVMHLAYVHYLYGNATGLHHVRQFTAAARGLGHTMDVYAMNLSPADADEDDARSALRQARGLLKKHLGRYLREPRELASNLSYLRRERRLMDGNRPDVLLVRNKRLTFSCVPLARSLSVPLVLEINAPPDEARLYQEEYAHIPWVSEYLERYKLRHADAVVTVSAALKTHLSTRLHADATRIVVAPNGADIEIFHPAVPADAEVSSVFGSADPIVGFVGSFQKWHGSGMLARMIVEVSAARPNARFLMVGDGPELEPARRACAGVCAERVLFTGRVDHARVPGLVACMNVAVVADAGFYMSPLKVIEWMAAGRAVVAPAYGPLAEVIDNEVDGLLFPPGDVSSLAAGVIRLIDDVALRTRLGRAAAERVRCSLTWRHNAERVLESCHLAIRRRAGRNEQLGHQRPGG